MSSGSKWSHLSTGGFNLLDGIRVRPEEVQKSVLSTQKLIFFPPSTSLETTPEPLKVGFSEKLLTFYFGECIETSLTSPHLTLHIKLNQQ